MSWLNLKDYDMFGHQIQMNYNRASSTYNTKCGGCISFTIKLMMTFLISYKFYIMMYKLDDSVVRSTHSIDLEDEGAKNYTDTNMNMFWVIRDYHGGKESAVFMDDVKD